MFDRVLITTLVTDFAKAILVLLLQVLSKKETKKPYLEKKQRKQTLLCH